MTLAANRKREFKKLVKETSSILKGRLISYTKGKSVPDKKLLKTLKS
ncbi:MAG: hypothetical protein ACRD38_06820 [Nitrososphaerales archaeon]